MSHPIRFFDHTFVVNLEDRPDRLESAKSEMAEHRIPYTVFTACRGTNGQDGIYTTLMKIFRRAISRHDAKSILVFEDDVRILRNNFNSVIHAATNQLPERWHMLYLGANLPKPELVTRYSENLLRVKRALALHAVAYSREGMEAIMALPKMLPVDLQIANFLQQAGHSYMVYPMLCTQHDGISDIEKTIDESGVEVGKAVKNDERYISPRYQKVCQQLNIKP